MSGSNTTAKGLALALGCAASVGTAYTLLRDDVAAGRWSDSYVLVPILLCIACGAGHLAAQALKDRSILSALGFAIAFTMATILTVWTSVSKQAATTEARTLETVASNKDRGAVEAALRDAELRYRQALDQADKARSSGGCGRVCSDWQKRSDEVIARIRELKAELKSMDPQKPVAAGAERVAQVIHMLSGFEVGKVKALLELVEPFAYSLVFELAVIVCFGYGFSGPRRSVRTPGKEAKTQPTPSPEPPGGDKRDPHVVSWCEEYARRHGRRPSIPEVQAAFSGMSKTSAWRYSRSRHRVA